MKNKKKMKIATFEVKIRWEGGDDPKFGITGFVDLSEVKILMFSDFPRFHLFHLFHLAPDRLAAGEPNFGRGEKGEKSEKGEKGENFRRKVIMI